MFKEYNPNPNKLKTGDCVVRALTKVTGSDWDTVYKELYEIGFEMKAMPNSDIVYTEYLKRKGFVNISIKVTKGSTRPTVKSFTETNTVGTYVLKVANHIVASVDGDYYDTWDSGGYSLYRYFVKTENSN